MMTQQKYSLFFLSLFLLCTACGPKDQMQAYWENAPVVAKAVPMEHGDLIDFNPELLAADTMVFPLSYFTEEIEIVKLEDSDAALLSPNQRVLIFDNYILALVWETTPCKLFDRQGRYITDIGGIGNGPGEYRWIASASIDEARQRIYLFGGYSQHINVYDLTGKVQDAIKLPRQLSNCAFTFKDDLIRIVTSPTAREETIAWTQTADGEIVDSIPSAYLKTPESTWALGLLANKELDPMPVYCMTTPGRTDSLYHVDFDRKAMIPRFTMDFSKRDMQVHEYEEWPDHFIGSTSVKLHIVAMNDDGTSSHREEGEEPSFYIIDKKTLKGSYFRIENDFLPGENDISQPVHVFNEDYYVKNVDPGDLAERLERILQSELLSDNMRKKYTSVLENMGDDDNNYILFAKRKK